MALTQQVQFTPEHWQRVKLKLKAFVTRVSFLVQLQSSLVTFFKVTFLHWHFSSLSDGTAHVNGLVLFPLVPFVFGLVPLLLVVF